MRKSVKLMAAAALALGFAVAPRTKAAITNGGFETGDFTGYNTLGDASIQTLGTGFNPPQGNDVAFLNNDPSGSNVYDGTPATTNVNSLDTFSGLAAGTLEGDGVQSGTAISQSFSATAGNTISFDFNFLTNEPGPAGNQDFAYYTLSGPGIGTVTVNEFANPTTPAGTVPPLDSAQAGIYAYLGGAGTETGYLTDSFGISTTGTYTLTFGVTNVGDTSNSSGLLIDNITGATNGNNGGGGGGGAVPLPAAALLAPALLALAGRYTVKLRKQAQA